MDMNTAIEYANALAARLKREITGPSGHAFKLHKKMKTKEGGWGFIFTSETYSAEYVLRCSPTGEIKLHVHDKDGSLIRKNIRNAQYGAETDVNHLFNN